MENNIIPVYLITGFLESGKTLFLQDTLADPDFNKGENTLVLLCEEGVEELDLDVMPFGGQNVKIVNIENESDLRMPYLARLAKESKPERVMIEYNGMWQLDSLYNALPELWQVCQEFMFVDGSTFEAYNANMRSLMVDKLTSANTVIFNRVKEGFDKELFHKNVRAVTRAANILYEYASDRHVEADDIEDPLPFDFNAPIIEIADKDFAWFYRDIAEDPEKYHGKTVTFKGICAIDPRFPRGSFVIGRHVMVCCAEDTAYRAFACDGILDKSVTNGMWLKITADIKYVHHKIYDSQGPVLKLKKYEISTQPEEVVATFM